MAYEQYLRIIDEKAKEIFAVSDGIWDHAELPFQERQSTAGRLWHKPNLP